MRVGQSQAMGPRADSPVLIACAHGTRDPEGQRVVAAIVSELRDSLEVEVVAAYVDVQEPSIAEVVAANAGRRMVVVPLLLAGGYHVYHDIADVVKAQPGAVSAPALGPDPRLVELLVDRLRDAGAPSDATVVLAAAGSSDRRAIADTEATADLLRLAWRGPVRVGYAAAAQPTVADAVEAARAFGESVVAVASYLLAPGHFHTTLAAAGADFVSAPLGANARVIDVIAERYAAAATGRAVASAGPTLAPSGRVA